MKLFKALIFLLAVLAACLWTAKAGAVQEQHRTAERLYEEGRQLQYKQGSRDALQQAAIKYEEALAVWRSGGDLEAQAKVLGSLSGVYSSLGDYRRAIDYLKRRMQVLQQLRERYLVAGQSESAEVISRRVPPILEQIGLLSYTYLSDKAQALEALNQAKQLYQGLTDQEGVAHVLTLIGQVYTNLGEDLSEKQKAVEYFSQVLSMRRAARNRYDEGDALANLMLAWKAQQKPRLAIFYGKQSVNIYQSLRAGLVDLEKDTQDTFRRSKADTYRVLADLLIAEGRLPEAEQVLSLLKAEEYFEFIRSDDDADSALTNNATLTAEEAKLNEEYKTIADQLTTLGRERGALRDKPARTPEEEGRLNALEEQLALANQVFEKFLDRLTEELSGTAQAEKVVQLREGESLQANLRDLGSGTVALYTLVGAEKYRVILITPDVRKAYEYPITSADLAGKVFAFKQALQNPRQDPRPLAQEMYRILLGPLAKDLEGAGAQTLMWSLDGVLRYIPMAALHDGKQYLVEHYQTVVFTTANLISLKDQPKPNWKGLGFGVSKPHEGFQALSAVPAELRAIFREEAQGNAGDGVLPGQIMLDEAFTLESMKVAMRTRAPLIHIASHFVFNPGSAADSFLLLGDGQHLNMAQFKNIIDLGGVDLLTLSACNTATSNGRADGKEVDGFATIAQRKGAKAVIASLWSVADASTQLLMQRFYRIREAQAGLSKAEALRQAQLSLLRDTTGLGNRGIRLESKGANNVNNRGLLEQVQAGRLVRFAHPFYWAPFVLVGNWK